LALMWVPPSFPVCRAAHAAPPAPGPLFWVWLRRPRGARVFPYATLFRSSETAGTTFCSGLELNTTCFVPAVSEVEPFSLNCGVEDRKSTRLNSSHVKTSYAAFCLTQRTA